MSHAARALAEVALEIAREQARIMARLRVALERGDDATALRLARVLTGLEEESAEGDRANARQH